jgi:hypothetical protein
VGHWWEQILHNQSALRLKGRLLFQPGVMVTNVPWQLESSERLAKPRPQTPAGSFRRGYEPPAPIRDGRSNGPRERPVTPSPAAPVKK